MYIQKKKVTNPRKQDSIQWLVGEDGLLASEEQAILGLAFSIALGLILTILSVLILLGHKIIGFIIFQPLIALVDILWVSLTSMEGINYEIKKKMANWLAVIAVTVGVYLIATWRWKAADKSWGTIVNRTGAYSLIQKDPRSVPDNCLGVPVVLGQPRRWFLYLPTDKVNSLLGTINVLAIEITTQSIAVSLVGITSKDRVELISKFFIMFDVYDPYTAAIIDRSPNTNVWAMVLDLLQGNARTVLNSMKYDAIDGGKNDFVEAVNERLWELLKREYNGIESFTNEKGKTQEKGVTVYDPRQHEDGEEKRHEIVRVGHLGIYLQKVVCQSAIASAEYFRRSREASMVANQQALAQKEIIKQLKTTKGYEDLEGKELVDQANLILNRFNQNYFIDFADGGGSGALEKLVAAMLTKLGAKS